MLILRPISAHDSHMLEHSIALMRHFGRLEGHVLRLAPTQSQHVTAEAAAEMLREICDDVAVLPLNLEGDGRWPQSPNLQFVHALEAVATTGNRQPIFWMELDCDPVIPNWADKIETAWRVGRTPFCGKIVPVPLRDSAGNITIDLADTMMMGCGVYPPNILNAPNIQVYFKGFRQMTNPEPWDVFLRGWMRKAGWSNTDLIGDRWNTIDYQPDFSCRPGPTNFKARDHSTTSVKGCAVIHGCKDGSLARIILSGATAQEKPSPPPTPSVCDSTSIAASIAQARTVFEHTEQIARLEAANEELQQRVSKLETFLYQVPTTATEPAPEFTPTQEQPEEEPPPITEEIIPNGHPDPATIRGMMVSGKGRQIKKFARELGMDRKKLVSIINAENSGLRLHNGIVSLIPT